MIIKHYYIEKIAHSSYILAGRKSCAVIDPSRDVDIYIKEAGKLGVEITHILQTHLHADFISGHMDLAHITGARIFVPAQGRSSFDHRALREGDFIELEDIKISVMETPGHTPEHISYIVRDLGRGDDPVAVFVGDTIFVGDVGRPDLFPDIAEELAKKLYDSVFNKLFKLPDYCEVYPAHGSGSLCGKSIGAKYTTTIGYEKAHNALLAVKDREEFVKMLTKNMPEAPDHFSRSSAINGKGPVRLDQLAPVEAIESEIFLKLSRDNEYIVVDVRSCHAFGGLHIPGSYSFDILGNIPTFAGWVLPPEKNILLVAENLSAIKEAVLWLRRVGLDNITGYLKGGIHTWTAMGMPVKSLNQMSIDEFLGIDSFENMLVIDTRDRIAYNSGHIDGAINISSPDLRYKYKNLPRDKKIILVCSFGIISCLGASILLQNGFEKVNTLAGGMQAYIARSK